MALDEEGQGVLEVGASAPLPPPDPTRAYPPAAEEVYSFEHVLFPGFSSQDGCWVRDEGGEVSIDCGLLSCLSACSCDADGCTAGGSDTPDVEFDGALEADGAKLVGTLVIDGARIVVRMTKS